MPSITIDNRDLNFTTRDMRELELRAIALYLDLVYLIGKKETRRLVLTSYDSTFTLLEKITKLKEYLTTPYRKKVLNYYLLTILTKNT